MITFIIIIACYLLGLIIGWTFQIISAVFRLIVHAVWWLLKKVFTGLLCGAAFCFGYTWSYIKNNISVKFN
jgi:hypothetical protein